MRPGGPSRRAPGPGSGLAGGPGRWHVMGMREEPFPELAQLFGAYFHQDWQEEFANPEAALRAFLRSASPASRSRARQELRRLLTRTDAALGEMCAGLGCAYLPPRAAWRAWLTAVERRLSRPA